MRTKVELHPDVVWFVRRQCSEAEPGSFYGELEKVRRDPIENSEHFRDPNLSRYMLRCFRFARIMAVFKHYPAKNLIRVLECRRIRPKQRRRENPANGA